MNDALYRPNVGIVLQNTQGYIFVGKRIDASPDEPVYWQMPQGGIDDGEDPACAAMRELLEEIGTNQARITHRTKGWLYYDLPQDLRGKLWGGHYIGQRQIWFLLEFLGSDTDINLKTYHPEFREMQWVTPEEAIALIVPFKKDIYKKVLREFKLIE